MLANILILFPFVVALLVYITPSRNAKMLSIISALVLLSVNIYTYLIYKNDPGSAMLTSETNWISSINAKWLIDLDGISLFMTLLTTIITPIIFSTFENNKYSSSFYALAWMMIGAMMGVFTAKDGLLFYIFWELALIPIYFICLIWGGENRGKITFKFFLYTLFGSLFMLAGLLYLYQVAGSWEIGQLYEAGRSLTDAEQRWVFWALLLGFAIKMPIFPFHTWQPDTYNVAPSQGTMLLSGIMSKMGTYGLIRWLIPVVPSGVAAYSDVVVILSVFTIVYASVIALVQKDIKRLMAWSSIAHIALISAGVFSFTSEGLKGALVQMLAHGINIVALFYIVNIIFKRTHTQDMENLSGIRSKAPVLALFFLIITLGSVALPLTNGFVGEFLLISGVFQYNFWYAAFAGLTIILGATYMLRAYQKTMLGDSNALTASFEDVTRNEKITLIIITLLIFIFGLFPNVIIELITPGVEALLNGNLGTRELVN